MSALLTGVHHVTAFAKGPRENVDFYTRVLGLRLVKKTVNFDDPLTYHLYYGDTDGSPGTLITHFPHPAAKRGRHGTSEIERTLLGVAPDAINGWANRLASHGVTFDRIQIGDEVRIVFEDHDGMRFALVPVVGATGDGIAGILGAEVRLSETGPTVEFLEQVMGFERVGTVSGRHRLHLGSDRSRLELIEDDGASAVMGAGVVHHLAWRVPDEAAQARVADAVRSAGVGVTPVRDRHYFRSIYFRVPGGVIFEVATDGPGFAVDEAHDSLGASLKLPPQYEARRAEIEAALVPLGSGAG